MNKIKKLTSYLLVLITSLSLFVHTASAESKSIKGIDIEVVTDKDAYKAGEVITSILRVKNNNSYSLTNVDLQILIPEGLELAEKSRDKLSIDELKANETAELSLKLKESSKKSIAPTVKSGAGNNAIDDSKSQSPARSALLASRQNTPTTSTSSTNTTRSTSTNPTTIRRTITTTRTPLISQRTGISGSSTVVPQVRSTPSVANAPVPTPNTSAKTSTGPAVASGDQVRTGIGSILPVAVIGLIAATIFIASKKRSSKKIMGLLLGALVLSLGASYAYANDASASKYSIARSIKVAGKDYTIEGQVSFNKAGEKPGKADPVHVRGRALNAKDDDKKIENVKLTFSKDGKVITTTNTDGDGNYSADIIPGAYDIKVEKDGYKPFNLHQVLNDKENITIGDLLLVPDRGAGLGNSKIAIKDAKTGDVMADTKLKVRRGWNAKTGDIIEEAYTDKNGIYDFSLEPGNYTIETEKDGYITNYINIVSYEENGKMQYASIVETMTEDDYTIVLEWGNYPKDLDAYVTGKSAANGKNIKVYFANVDFNNGKFDEVSLDRDDKSFYGPETMTIKPVKGSTYKYFVRNYEDGKILKESKVSVYKGNKLDGVYYIPKDSGNLWDVGEIDENGDFKLTNKVDNDLGKIKESPKEPEKKESKESNENKDQKLASIKSAIKDAISKEAIAGVNVEFYRDGKLVSSLASGSDGSFAIDLAPGTYVAKLAKDGYETTSYDLVIPNDGKVDVADFSLNPITKTFETIDITGKITDTNGNPVADAKVRFFKDGKAIYTSATDENGNITGLVKPDFYQVEISKAGFKTSTAPAYIKNTIPSHDLSRTLEPATYEKIATKLYIKDQAGSPIEGATVTIADKAYSTDKNGHILVELSPGSHKLAISKDGYNPATYGLDLVNSRPSHDQDFILTEISFENVRLNGTIKSAGAPVADLDFTITSAGKTTNLRTDHAGNFETNLTPGSYSLSVNDARYNPYETSFDVTNKTDAIDKTFELTAKTYDLVSLNLSIVENDETTPVTGANVTLTNADTNISASSNTHGDLSLLTKPGTYKLSVKKEGYADITEDIEIKNTEPTSVIKLNLARTTYSEVTLSGFVYGPNAAHIPNGSIQFVKDSVVVDAATITDSAYEIKLAAGRYDVIITADNFLDEKLTLDVLNTSPKQTKNFNLSIPTYDTVELTGMVYGDENGLVVENGTIEFIQNRKSAGKVEIVNGSYAIDLAPGTYAVNILSAGYDPYVNHITIINTNIQQAQDFNITETSFDEIDFVATTISEGQSVANVEINLEDEDGKAYKFTTNAAGEVRATLAPGSYKVHIDHPGTHPIDDSFAIATNKKAHDQVFDLTPIIHDEITFTATITDGTKPLDKVAVVIGNETKTTDAKGMATFTLKNGNHTMSLSKEGYNPTTLDLVLDGREANVNRDYILDLETYDKTTFRGQITSDVTTKALRDVEVIAYKNGAIADSTKTDANGNFSLDLVAGTYDIDLNRAGYNKKTDQISITNTQKEYTKDYILELTTYDMVETTIVVAEANGDPIGGADVTIKTQNGDREYKSNRNGQIVLNLRPGTYNLVANKDGYGEQSVNRTISNQSSTFGIELNLSRITYNTVELTGTVIDDLNELITKGNISFKQNGQEIQNADIINGSYALALAPGTYQVEVSSLGHDTITDELTLYDNSPNASKNYKLNRTIFKEINLNGTVTDENGQNIPAGTITFLPGAGNEINVDFTDGSYRAQIAPGVYTVILEASGYDSATRQFEVLNTSENQTLNLTTNKSRYKEVSYTALFLSEGKILANQELAITDENGVRREISTNNTGYIREVLSPGTYTLELNNEAYEPFKAEFTLDGSIGKIDTIHQISPKTYDRVKFTARVSDGTSPLSGVKISSIGLDSQTTDSNGEATFDLAPGKYDLTFDKTGYKPRTETVIINDRQKEVTRDFFLGLPTFEQIEIAGSITDANTGNPIANANFVATATDGSSYPATSLADGSYKLTIKAGTYDISITKDGYKLENDTITLKQTDDKLNRNYKLSRQSFDKVDVQIEVKDKNGQAIENAKVNIIGLDEIDTNTDGLATFTNVSPNAYKVELSATGFISKTEVLNVTDDKASLRASYVLDKDIQNKAIFTGKVRQLDRQYDDLRDLDLAYRLTRDVGSIHSEDWLDIDSENNFRLELDPGIYEINVFSNRYPNYAGFAQFEILDYNTEVSQTIWMANMYQPEVHEGVVVNKITGTPIAGAKVYVGSEDSVRSIREQYNDNPYTWDLLDRFIRSDMLTATNDVGYFNKLTIDSNNPYLAIEANGYYPEFWERSWSFRGVETYELMPVYEQVDILGIVRENEPSQNIDLANATVTITGIDYFTKQAVSVTRTTNEDGIFKVRLTPGVYDIAIKKTGYNDYNEAQNGKLVVDGNRPSDSKIFVLDKKDLVKVSGVITDNSASAVPLENVTIKVTDYKDLDETIVTKADGKYEFNAEHGSVNISLNKEGYKEIKETIDILPGDSDLVKNFKLEPLTYTDIESTIKVVDENGAPVPNANVKILGLAPTDTYETSADGNLKLTLAPAEYTLEISKEGFRAATEKISIANTNKTFETTLILPTIPTYDLSIRFIDRDTKAPVSNANIKFTDANGVVTDRTTGNDGSVKYTITDGDFSVLANNPSYKDNNFVITKDQYIGQKEFVYELQPLKNYTYGIIVDDTTNTRKTVQNADVKIYKNGTDNIYRNVTTENDGTFSAKLESDDYKIVVAADGYLPLTMYQTIDENSNMHLDTIRLLPTTSARYKMDVLGTLIEAETVDKPAEHDVVSFTGKIEDFDSKSKLTNASVTITDRNNRIIETIQTGPTTSFTKELKPGVYNFSVERSGYHPRNYKVDISNAAKYQSFDFGLRKTQQTINLRFTDQETGQLYTNPLEFKVIRDNANLNMFTRDGKYSFVATGEDISIQVSSPNLQSTIIDLKKQNYFKQDNYTLTIPLKRTSFSITGSVKDGTGVFGPANPIVKAKITAYDENNNKVASTYSRNNGDYVLYLDQGTYTINATHPEYDFEPFTKTFVTGNNTATPSLIGQKKASPIYPNIDDDMLPEDHIHNTSYQREPLNRINEPIPGARVNVRKGYNNTTGDIVASASTNGSGLYALRLDPGYYTIETEVDGYVNSSFNITTYPNLSIEGSNVGKYALTRANADTMDFKVLINGNKYLGDIRLQMQAHNGIISSHSYLSTGILERITYIGGSISKDYLNNRSFGKADPIIYDAFTTKLSDAEYQPKMVHVPARIVARNSPRAIVEFYFDVARPGNLSSIKQSDLKVEIIEGNDIVASYYVPKDKRDNTAWEALRIIKEKENTPIRIELIDNIVDQTDLVKNHNNEIKY